MAIITMPPTLRCGAGCRIEQFTFDAISASEVTGSSQARTYGAPHWALSLSSPPAMLDADAGVWKAMLLGLRGAVNVLLAFDPSRPNPRGSYRGAPVLTSGLDYGATVLTMDGGAGQAARTLQPGDWLQIGSGFGTSQLVMAMAAVSADAAGVITVPFEAPLRRAYPAGTPITLVRASGHFRRVPARTGWTPYSMHATQAMGVDLLEAW